MKTILMSIRYDPFNAIIGRKKMHEFRRRFYMKEPCQVVFYVSSPICSILGVGIFDKPLKRNISDLVDIIKTHSFSSEKSLRDYLKGKSEGYAIPILKAKKINPISLKSLKNKIPGFFPPQSYYNLDPLKFKSLIGRLDLYETPNEII